jgi:hypothetical protein
MALYTCPTCSMSVTTACGTCGADLVDASLETANGPVRIAECPNGHGKIKSPLCCGSDMSCAV